MKKDTSIPIIITIAIFLFGILILSGAKSYSKAKACIAGPQELSKRLSRGN